MTSPTISVITPTHNRVGFLRQAVASVAAQSLEQWEMIVADDASEDGTWEYLQSLKETRVRSLRMEGHRERSAARNATSEITAGNHGRNYQDSHERGHNADITTHGNPNSQERFLCKPCNAHLPL